MYVVNISHYFFGNVTAYVDVAIKVLSEVADRLFTTAYCIG